MKITLQLTDRSTRLPLSMVEDLPFQVGKFYLPIDFIMIEMDEVPKIPLILGRPFLATAGTRIDVREGRLTFEVGNEMVTFDVSRALKYPSNESNICRIDIEQEMIDKELEKLMLDDPLRHLIAYPTEKEAKKDLEGALDGLEVENNHIVQHTPEYVFSAQTGPDSRKEGSDAPKVDLKPLLPTLRYEYLGPDETYPVIINVTLNENQTNRFLAELRLHRGALGYMIEDLKGISPSIYLHRILMEDDHKPTIKAQRRLNPNLKEIVWKEIHKLLDAGVIYLILDSKWASLVHVVPKKGGTTVVKTDDGKLISTRVVTGWRMCIDYRKLNVATRKDHFPLPFIDQMLKRLVKHKLFCYLDDYTGFFQISIHPEDQEKTTFTCSYGTFAYQRMPFGLYNAPATFQRAMMGIFRT
jgi:Reverse transcriptase (RNA-dependent DNA polymerase)